MNVVLTHGYFISADEKEQRIMKPYPPLGLLYLSAYLKQKDITCSVFDTTFSTPDDQRAHLIRNKPGIVAIYTNLMTKIEVVKLVKTLRTDAAFGYPTIVLGGPDVTYNVEAYLSCGAHFLVIGEGEETLAELVAAIGNHADVHQVAGIAFRANGETVVTPPRNNMRTLDDLPLPDRAAIDMQPYLDIWKRNHGTSAMTISTQRGCPYTCKWCSTAVYGQSYRRRPAAKVASEMAMLRETYNPGTIWFVDDVFTISHKWIDAFCEEVAKQDAMIPFECITRAERLNADVLQKLKSAGCFRIWIGAESGSQPVIDAMDRRVAVTQVRDMIKAANNAGIETGTFIMLGYPGETRRDITKTIRYLKAANPTHYTITVTYPIKGTALYSQVENDITIAPDWETSTDRDIDFKRTYRRRYYDFATRKVVNEVESHREWRKGTRRDWTKILKHKTKSWLAGTLMAIHR